jgi:PKD repeat protein
VSLTITDGNGATATLNQTVIVGEDNPNLYPTASWTWAPKIPATGETVQLDASGSSDPEGNITEYNWDLDDDGTVDVSGEIINHQFSTTGTKNITLYVRDNATQQAELTQTIVVDDTILNKQPRTNFNWSPRNPAPGERITFDASASYDPDAAIASYEWDIDNDGEYEANGVTHNASFDTAGTYTVSLRVNDERGATNVTSKQVIVGEGDQLEQGWSWDAFLVKHEDGSGEIKVQLDTAADTTLSDVIIEIYERGNESNRFPNITLGDVNSVGYSQPLTANETITEWVVRLHVTNDQDDRVHDQIVISPRRQSAPPSLPGWVKAGFAFVLLTMTAGLFSRVNFGAGAIILALEGAILWWVGLNTLTTGAAVGFALFIAIIGYLTQPQRGAPT